MKTSKTARIQAFVRAHILASIDLSGYRESEPTRELDKLRELNAIFNAEYGWAVPRMGMVAAIREWLSGLPSSCNVEFRSHEIIRFGYECGALSPKASAKATETAEDDWLEQWFMRCAMSLHALLLQAKHGTIAA